MQDCIKRAQQGCEESFNRIVHNYSERLYYFIVKSGVDRHTAEDICQETFIKAYKALSSYNPEYSFTTWLYTIGRRLAVSHHRSAKKHLSLEESDAVENIAAGMEEENPASEIWQKAEKLLAPREFEALRLRYEENLPVKETAQIMDMTGLHVRVILHRAKKKLRCFFEE